MQTTPANLLDPATLARCIALVEAALPRLAGRVTGDLVFQHHDIDSLDLMTLVLDAEQAFAIEIEDHALDGIIRVSDLGLAVQAQMMRDRTARPRGPVDEPLTQRDAEADGAAQGKTEDAA